MSKKRKMYGRGFARRWLTARAKQAGLTIVKRRGTVMYFAMTSMSKWRNVVCMRVGRYTLRNVKELEQQHG